MCVYAQSRTSKSRSLDDSGCALYTNFEAFSLSQSCASFSNSPMHASSPCVRARVCVCVHACVCARARACSVVWCSRNNIEANKCTQKWTRMRRDGRRAAGTRHGQTWLKVGTSVTWQSSFRARQVGMCTVLAVCEGARGTARRAQKQHCLSGARPSRQACGRDRTRAHALCVQSHSASHRQTRASARTHCPSLLLTSIRSCLATMMRRQSSWT